MDLIDRSSCIKCNEGGELLLCSENGCPLALHEECLGCPPRFDDAGNFYCPYCFYKQAVAELCESRRDVMLKKATLSAFMDGVCSEGPRRGSEKAEAENVVQLKIGGEEPNITNVKEDKIPGEHISLKMDEKCEICNVVEEKKIQGEEPGNPVTTTNDPFEKMQEEHKLGDAEEGTGDESSEASLASKGKYSSPNVTVCKMNDSKEREVEVVQEGSKPVREKNNNKKEPTTVNLRRRSSRVKQVTDAEANPPNRLELSGSPPDKLGAKVNKSVTPRCKRSLWTEEEEEMLKVGVQKYSTPNNKNLPWRKILEFGRHVFHATRTSTDLKDKWRSM